MNENINRKKMINKMITKTIKKWKKKLTWPSLWLQVFHNHTWQCINKKSVKVNFSESQVAIQVDWTAGRRNQMEFIRGSVNVWPSCWWSGLSSRSLTGSIWLGLRCHSRLRHSISIFIGHCWHNSSRLTLSSEEVKRTKLTTADYRDIITCSSCCITELHWHFNIGRGGHWIDIRRIDFHVSIVVVNLGCSWSSTVTLMNLLRSHGRCLIGVNTIEA